MTEISEQIERSKLREAHNVSRLLQAGVAFEHESTLAAEREGLLKTYRQRASHLNDLSSYHAKRLKQATEEFCQQLEQLKRR